MFIRNYSFFCIIALIISCDIHSGKTSDVAKDHNIILPAKTYLVKEDRGKVIGIKDGDTFELLIAGRHQVVRLAHIDCPEKNQPFGTRAKQYASKLCFGKWVLLRHNGKLDRNKRWIAEIIVDGQNVNKELIKAGLAWHFKKYSSDRGYARLEQISRDQRIGLWSESNSIAPWQWRKMKHA